MTHEGCEFMKSIRWTYSQFIKYVIPSIISMMFISLYTVIDGYFVSKYVDSNALASINIIMPLNNLALGLTIMFISGGSALISIALGAGEREKANRYFSLVTLVLVGLGFTMSIIGLLNIRWIMRQLGASDALMPYCIDYGKIIIMAIPFLIMQVSYEYFLRVDDQPRLSMMLTIFGGIINIVFDYIFIAKFGWGIKGAGYATALGIITAALGGVVYFTGRPKYLHYQRPRLDLKFLKGACLNGSSEMVGSFSRGITTFLFNITTFKYAGEAGVAAISVLMYLFFMFNSFAIGLTYGIQPVISYSLGAKNKSLIRDVVKKCFIVLSVMSVGCFIVVQIWGRYAVILFLKDDVYAMEIATEGMRIFSFALLMIGTNIFCSGYLTAINKGKISAIISFLHSFILVIPCILILPQFFDLKGVWLSTPIAELGTLVLSLYFIKRDKLLNESNGKYNTLIYGKVEL